MTNAEDLVSTGIYGLDTILGGGLSRPSLVVLIGAPGAGKTVLASQIIFHAARQGHRAIVFTSFSEGAEQYIQHMRSLTFFDAGLLSNGVQVLTLASQLTAEDSLPSTAMARLIRTSGANIVLLDGFQGADPLLPGGQSMRAMLSALATQIRYLDVTILVTIAGEVRDPHLYTEMTVADAAIGMVYRTEGRYHRRLLEVVKLRGRAQWPGLHSYQIDAQGVRVFPRIEGYLPARPQQFSDARVPFELPVLDHLLGGGPNVGTTTLLAGAPGVGKTMLGLYWAVANARPEAASLFISFAEQPDQLELKAAAFGLDLRGAVARGSVRLLRLSAVELNPDRFAGILLDELAEQKVARLVVDDVASLLHELGERTRDYLSALSDITYSAQITSMYMIEIAPFDGLRVNLSNTPTSVLGDNVLVIQQYEIGGALRRVLGVLRMRLSIFDRTLYELVLDSAGIHLAPLEDTVQRRLAPGGSPTTT